MIKLPKKIDFGLIAVFLLALVFFALSSSYSYLSQREGVVKWNSPDETANYYFAKSYAETGSLVKFEEANIIAQDLVRPRSFRSDNAFLKPVSFLGIILIYGQIAKFTSVSLIPYLTPFFASLGIIIFYLFIKRLFNRNIALMSAFLLASFPVYFYYSLRSMFHNILFIVLCLSSVYLLSIVLDKKIFTKKYKKFLSFKIYSSFIWKSLLSLISGSLIGLAVITRSSELLWLGPIFFFLILFYGKRMGLNSILYFLLGLFLGLMPALYYNQILYGSMWFGGYSEMNQSLSVISQSSLDLVKNTIGVKTSVYHELLSKIFRTIFFFGYKPEQSWQMFEFYFIQMFPWLAYLSTLGIIVLVSLNSFKPQKKYIFYLLSLTVLSTILILYYGSWRFSDNPNVGSHTIGNSYTRYWLPIYMLAIPLACLFLEFFWKIIFYFIKKRKVYRTVVNSSGAIAIFLISIYSINFLLFGSEEGLAYFYYSSKNNIKIGKEVISLTSPESIILTQYHDKVFFPERKIIMGLITEEVFYPYLVNLADNYPLYYFNFSFDEATVDYLNNGRLAKSNLNIQLVKEVDAKFSLYKISKINKNVE